VCAGQRAWNGYSPARPRQLGEPMCHAAETRHETVRMSAFVDLSRSHAVVLVCPDRVR